MIPRQGLRPFVLLLVIFAAWSARATAQNLLYVQHDGKPCLVLGASDNYPRIELNGKVVTVHGGRFALKPVDEYIPFFIAVRDLEVKSTFEQVNGSSGVNRELRFTARFEAGYKLDDVFLLLDLHPEIGDRTFFLYEVGRLQPNDAKPVHVEVPLTVPLGSGKFEFHLFVGGAEALHSELPGFTREAALDRMIAKRMKNKPDGGPRPFLGPTPAYPPALRKANARGEAVISLWIRTTGSVRDPEVKSASDPAFGESALAAARLWRFLPQVKNGQPVETKVEMPFVFTPPRPPADKS